MSSPVLQTSDLVIGYPSGKKNPQRIASDLNLQVLPNELICLVGPNGVGKSTLLRTLARLQPALGGQILLCDRALASYTNRELAAKISIVLTGQVQAGMMKVRELVGLGRFPFTGLFDLQTEHDAHIVAKALEMVSAAELTDRYLETLSDGERQKVMIARALAQEAQVLILDEPTAFLDLPGRVSMMHLLRNLAQEHGKAVLTSTHDLDLALHNADRVWLMRKDGSISQGAPEDLVLSGQFGHTFTQGSITFDPTTGSFGSLEKPKKQVILQAQGLARIWTERALQRGGFKVLVEGSETDPRVQAYGDGERLHWRFIQDDLVMEFDTIYALMMALNE